ncbi:MAG: hypothetical protein DI536_18495 [Archangium gephyra]|uniref:Uncharacterized protein n=1 Tax=Archangium gephyra TaxID=48 RepID=A0A2W5UPZ3_9BACT|nr:MAG: hypothetical protein DI536_18495 [Archangium gephyra]
MHASSSSDCRWTFSQGLIKSDTNTGLAVNAHGGPAHNADIKIVNNCSTAATSCLWSTSRDQR